LRLTTITQSAGGTTGPEVTIAYDGDGLETKVSRSINASGIDVVTTYAYDAANDVTLIGSYHVPEGSSLSPMPVESNDATYNTDQQLTQEVETYSGTTTTTYSYDNAGQVTGSTGASNDSYTYDLNGNRDSTGYTTGAGNEMTNSPGVTYTYDNVGNMISATTTSGTTTYTYDYENRLTNVTENGTVVATYTYNALGQRIGIDDSGTQTWTVYNGNSADANPYADFNSSGGLQMRYLDGLAVDELFARSNSSGATAWYITDELGSVTDVVSSSGTDLDHVVYDPFGNIVTETNASNGDRFKFAGMEYDSTTGLYYDHARYYDSVTGRFMSQDPMGFAAGDTNLYRYVGNYPTGLVDDSGEDDQLPNLPGNVFAPGPITTAPVGTITITVTGPTTITIYPTDPKPITITIQPTGGIQGVMINPIRGGPAQPGPAQPAPTKPAPPQKKIPPAPPITPKKRDPKFASSGAP
jgi:RHS repeat-associated protein